MDFNTLIEIIEEAGYTPYSYSGRNMYGDHCVGFTTDENEFATCAMIVGAAEQVRRNNDTLDTAFTLVDFLDVLSDAKTDSMGLSTVVYFPHVKWEGE
jgi:hypothetical protein